MAYDRARFVVEIDSTEAERQLRGLHATAAGEGGDGGTTAGGRVGTGGGGGSRGPRGGGVAAAGGGVDLAKLAAAVAALAPFAVMAQDFMSVVGPIITVLGENISKLVGFQEAAVKSVSVQNAASQVTSMLGPAAGAASDEQIRRMIGAFQRITEPQEKGRRRIRTIGEGMAGVQGGASMMGHYFGDEVEETINEVALDPEAALKGVRNAIKATMPGAYRLLNR